MANRPKHVAAPKLPWILTAVVGVLVIALAVYYLTTRDSTSAAPPSATPSQTTPVASATPTPTETSAPPSPTPTGPSLAWGPSEADLQAGIATAASLPLEQVAGQVIIARYSGLDPSAATSLVSSLHLGGIILFGENIGTQDQVLAATSAIAAAGADGRDWPLAIGVDQEGGTVERLGPPWTPFPTFQTNGALWGPGENNNQIVHAYAAQAVELRAAGFTMDFAPDADVTIGPGDVTIGSRSASSDPQRAADAVEAAMLGYYSEAVVPSLKHFPGHGSVTSDSHTSLPVQNASIAELEQRDFVPFKQGINSGAPMVMVGHIEVSAWGPGPASLNSAAYGYLRNNLGFTGVTITDGLDMEGVTAGRTAAEIAVTAISSGADVLLTPTSPSEARQGLIDAVNAGTLSRDRLNEAAGRFITLQRYQAQLAAADPVDASAIGSAAPEARTISELAVTILTGQCGGGPLIGASIHVHGGTPDQWQGFVDAAGRAGLTVVPLEQPATTEVRLLEDSTTSGDGDIVIALDQPYGLATSNATVKVALYGDTPTAFDAVLAVLIGTQVAPGSLPVPVGDLAVGSGCPT